MDKKKVKSHLGRENLSRNMKKRIQTTMIGAIASIEEYFGQFWGKDSESPTASQERFREIFEELRDEILDKGNTQIRSIDADLAKYEVEEIRYNYNLPIVHIKPENMKFRRD